MDVATTVCSSVGGRLRENGECSLCISSECEDDEYDNGYNVEEFCLCDGCLSTLGSEGERRIWDNGCPVALSISAGFW